MGVNVENMRLWVKALRSGEWEQGRFYLEAEGRNCCLGVACRVAVANGLELAWGLQPGEGEYDYIVWFGAEGNTGVLPVSMMRWLGLWADDGERGSNIYLETAEGRKELATMLNDHRSYTFMDIADAIETTWPEVREQ